MPPGPRHRGRPLSDIRLFEPDVRDGFDPATFQRGDNYQRRGKVLEMVLEEAEDGPELLSAVAGSGGNVYEVAIELTPVGGGADFICFCSCPVEVGCKHAAATLLHAIRQGWFNPAGITTVRPGKALSGAPAPTKAKPVDPLAGPLRAWLDQLEMSTGTVPPPAQGQPVKKAPAAEVLLYCFDVKSYPNGSDSTTLSLIATRPLKNGGWGAGRPVGLDTVASSTARHVSDADRAIARILTSDHRRDNNWPVSGNPEILEWVMERILASGRAHWQSKDGVGLFRGPDRTGRLGWRLNARANQILVLEPEEGSGMVLPGPCPWVVDPETGACGRLVLPVPAEMLGALLTAPAIPPEAAAPLAAALQQRFPDLPIASPRSDIMLVADDSPPTPVLRLTSQHVPADPYWGRNSAGAGDWVDGAWLSFDYGIGTNVTPTNPAMEFREVDGPHVRVRKRRPDVEKSAMGRLLAAGLASPDPYDRRVVQALKDGGMTFPAVRDPKNYGRFLPANPFAWPAFMMDVVPKLIADIWRVEIADGFRHRTIHADGDWQAEIEDRGGWWFSLDIGIEVEGERVPLLPVLIAALAGLKPGASLESLSHRGMLYSPLPDGRTLALPFDRVRRLVEVLVELFGDRPLGDGVSIDLSLAQAVGLEAIAEATRLRWVGAPRLRDLVDQLRQTGMGMADRSVPAAFRAQLRDYQQVGFGWMQFLAEQGLGGVLADDMGLGKTVQTLAHMLAEKMSGRMQGPFLVVCPTSLAATWRDEAARFAPDLAVLVMHGQGRPRDAEAFQGMDVVISTYPLLIRDDDLLTGVDWHGVVLDEAQAIKNPASRWTQVACQLKANHRICLTGTPVENHLGEAWSLFAFLMPGLLGDSKNFAKLFRTPIEKKNDGERRQLLSRRLKPFLLRRTKAEVAAELPPKTEMIRWIDLAGGQRDLYETLRLAMDSKVREAIATKGLARSSIIILDALLKLRQACCDPRLVRLKGAAKTNPASAKLDHLMEFLPSLVEEGRRILLFSQFTSMLDLIKPELKRADIPFVELRGDTVDREGPVRAFQAGEVPLFLISLKAGGVGLTLTAADTVIHYDPWWNPAVEDQATDRAHRIGQDKPVFVYKLIATGTVEERMLELQERKRSVATALFDPDAAGPLTFTEEDLAALFQPI